MTFANSFASRALALGESLNMIGRLLGHTDVETTARYVHLARDSVQEAAARVAASIGADILPEGSAMASIRRLGSEDRFGYARWTKKMARRIDLGRTAAAGVPPHAGQCGPLERVFHSCCRAAGDCGDFQVVMPVSHDLQQIDLSMKYGA